MVRKALLCVTQMKIGTVLAVVGVVSTTQMVTVDPAHPWEYGALAAGSCKQKLGKGVSNASEYDAESNALRDCRRNGGTNCKPVAKTKGREGCTAFAVSGTRCEEINGTGVGYGATREAARKEAVADCRRGQFALHCQIPERGSICPAEEKGRR
jgi:Domain of unknown function (DUF4189)